MRRSVWCLMVYLFVPIVGSAASFDCDKARTEVEKMICANAELSLLDDELARAYFDAREHEEAEGKVELRDSQRTWLKNRNNVCAKSIEGSARWHPDRRCLKAAYEYRIWKLAPARVEQERLREGRYRVGWGWDRPLCRKLAAHLNANPHLPPPVCQLRLGASNPDFALPEWQVLDIRGHRGILKTIWDGDKPPEFDRNRIFQERFEANQFKLSRAFFDVNNSGEPRTVYRAELDPCNPQVEIDFRIPSVPRLYAVDPDGKRPSDSFS